MAYSALELIDEAYNLSGIVRSSASATNAQASRGLTMLNRLLALKSSSPRLIPYITLYSLNTIISQEAYFVANLIDADTVTYNLNTTLRTPLTKLSRSEYFGTSRIDGLTTLPGVYYIERVKGGANIYIYPLANQVYPVQIIGKFNLSSVTKTTDLEQFYDGDYIGYLAFALARYLCLIGTVSFPVDSANELARIEKQLIDKTPLDLTFRKTCLFNKQNKFNIGYANLGNGYSP